MRDREASGISLQEVRTELQMSLLQPANENSTAVAKSAGRGVRFADGLLVEYCWQGQKSLANVVRNQKYSLLTFVPKVLYQQFQYFFNLFYLLTALSQFIPGLKVGLMFSFVAPLLLVIALTMMKEAYEDIQRFKKDRELNSALFTKLQGGINLEVKSSDLKVGDILEVGVGDSLPADCLYLSSTSEKPSLFIKTDQLDGETDWKLRKPTLHSYDLTALTIEFTPPTVNVYEFVGSFTIGMDETIGIGLEQTLWRGVKVASGRGLVMVVYVGPQTKLSLNSKQAGDKLGQLDIELNFLSKVLFTLLLSLAVAIIILRGSYGTPGESIVLTFKYLLLLSSIIPISMRVNLDFARLLYKFHIDHDSLMPGCLCRNSNIPEELGRISYVLSDKTGTLTQNQMIFRKLMLSADLNFESEDIQQLRFLASQKENCKDYQVERVQRAVQALLLCHNVTPVFDNGVRGLQGSSPDELTLVTFAESLGFQIKQRSQDALELITPDGQSRMFQILQLFPFSSETKNMGIMVLQGSKINYYLKGADAVMQSKIPSSDAHFMAEACLDLANQGLRTLVIAQKTITPECYAEWKKQLTVAGASLKGRDEKVAECRRRLEQGMVFVGVTGVQDKLQVGVNETIGSLRSIGVKVWMLTGDKIETAICVGRAVRLIQGRDERLFLIQGVKTRSEFIGRFEQFYTFLGLQRQDVINQQSINCVLVIDGTSLKWALEEIARQFFELAVRLPAIICSRVSPTQKAEVALLVREWGQGRVLGIGDGGNDVALIQSAHVGVGIYGKEGIQAALASDFSISTFSDLNGLLFWHGRLSYKRSSLLAQFIMHRGLIITIMQAIFTIQFFFVALPIYNGLLLLGYSTIFTMLPVFSLVLDEDISREVAMEYPVLYKTTQAGNELNTESFLYWIIISVYQGAVIMILIDLLVGVENFYMVSTISFTCLIVIEFLNLLTELHRIRWVQVCSIAVSVIVYLCSILFMKKTLNGAQLLSTAYLPATIVIVFVAWGPPFAYERLKRWTDPTLEQKIMSQSVIIEDEGAV